MIKIQKVSNGYILEKGIETLVYPSIEELFNDLLLFFEGKSSTLLGDSYGEVKILRGKKTK